MTTSDWDETYDAVLVGSGAGALCAAIELQTRGLRPVIVEKSALVGGGGAYSGGVIWMPNNHRMRAKNLSDSVEDGLLYLATISQGRGDSEIARAYLENGPRILETLEEKTPVRFVTWPNHPDYYAELPGGRPEGRFLLPHPDLVSDELDAYAEKFEAMNLIRRSVHLVGVEDAWVAGRALIASLWAQVLELGVEYWTGTRARRLIRNDSGRVEGVVVERDGQELRIASRGGILLNTGGFEWNSKMNGEFITASAILPQTPPSNEGDGHVMAAALGAELALMDLSIFQPVVKIPDGMNDDKPLYRMFFQELALPHSIIVNQQGKRFANETYYLDIARGWNTYDPFTATFPNLPCFQIFDDQYREQYGTPSDLEDFGLVHKYESLDALASAQDIDPDGLQHAIDRYNQHVETGVDEDFGRGGTRYQLFFGDPTVSPNSTMGSLTKAPYYLVELFPGTSGHRGGVRTDARGRVLDVQGAVIDGLFACGNTAASVLVGASYVSGVSIGHSVVFGTLAAEQIGDELTSKSPS